MGMKKFRMVVETKEKRSCRTVAETKERKSSLKVEGMEGMKSSQMEKRNFQWAQGS